MIYAEKTTLDEARTLRDRLNSHRIPRSPLRHIAVVVAGPNEGYVVCSLGLAEESGLDTIS